MPWDCSTCGTTAVLDDEPACPSCGGGKAAWTMHVDKTRTFRTSRREKLELLRGTDGEPPPQSAGYPPDVELLPAERAVSLPKAMARDLADQGLLPPTSVVLVARLHPRVAQDPTVTTTALFDVSEVVPAEHPQEPLTEAGKLDVWFVLVHGEESVEGLTFPGLIVLDVTEPTPAGHAPQLGVAALGSKRKDLPIDPWPPVLIHAQLLLEPDGAVVGPAELSWEKDGVALAPDDPLASVLPASVGEDGVIKAERLPLGTYTVAATMGQVELERVALPLQSAPDEAPHQQWVCAPHIHAQLLREPDGAVVRLADLAWEKDGVAVTAADLPGAVLPASIGEDGVLRADRLPYGSYTVAATLQQDGLELERVALPLQSQPDPTPHLQWVRLGSSTGCIHAQLLREPDGAVVGPADLLWEKDGAAVTQADLGERAVLPASVGPDGVIRAERLPLGDYALLATPTAPDEPGLEPVVVPLQRTPDRMPHLQWVRVASPRAFIRARLRRAPDGAPVTGVALAWEKDGAPVTAADLPGATLPDAVGSDGVIRADKLPWGAYTVQAASEGKAQLERVGLPLLARADAEVHEVWVRAVDPGTPEGKKRLSRFLFGDSSDLKTARGKVAALGGLASNVGFFANRKGLEKAGQLVATVAGAAGAVRDLAGKKPDAGEAKQKAADALKKRLGG